MRRRPLAFLLLGLGTVMLGCEPPAMTLSIPDLCFTATNEANVEEGCPRFAVLQLRFARGSRSLLLYYPRSSEEPLEVLDDVGVDSSAERGERSPVLDLSTPPESALMVDFLVNGSFLKSTTDCEFFPADEVTRLLRLSTLAASDCEVESCRKHPLMSSGVSCRLPIYSRVAEIVRVGDGWTRTATRAIKPGEIDVGVTISVQQDGR